MSDYPMLISNKLHSFSNFFLQFSSFLLLLHIVKEYLYDYECI